MGSDSNVEETEAAKPEGEISLKGERWSLGRALGRCLAALAILALGTWITNAWIISAAEPGSPIKRFAAKLTADMLTFGVPGLMIFVTIWAGVSTLSAIFPRSAKTLETSLRDQRDVRGTFGLSLEEDMDAFLARQSEDIAEQKRRHEALRPDFLVRPSEPPSEIDQIKSRSSLAVESSLLFTAMRFRLIQDQDRLRSNARVNLMIGGFVALIAATILGIPLVNGQAPIQDLSHIWTVYAVRFPVSITLQLVSFFFLRLYVATENDIKHNKNEVTNIEAKFLSFLLAREANIASEDSIIALAQTERNFVLRRGEKTVGSENDAHYNDLKSLLDRLIAILPGLSSSKG